MAKNCAKNTKLRFPTLPITSSNITKMANFTKTTIDLKQGICYFTNAPQCRKFDNYLVIEILRDINM